MTIAFNAQYSLNTAVLFLVFNRPDTTARVFEAIRQAKPPRLYVASDGPRDGLAGDTTSVANVRQIATAVDWPCEVKTLYQSKNLGCKYGPKTGIDWFFEQEERGIILEDDCLPHPDFFGFCEMLLERYCDDERVCVITGNNFQNGQRRGSASYYFSRYNHVWGWATWRRAWSQNDTGISFWPEWRVSKDWKNTFPDSVESVYWRRIFDRVYEKRIETAWDYPWTASVWYRGGLTATPNVNLVSNIGFGPGSTHTASVDSPLAVIATSSMGEIAHPGIIVQDIEADRYTFDNVFGGKLYRFPWSWLRLPRLAAGFIYRSIKRAVA